MNIPDEILEATDPKWKECLIGYFVGKRLPFKLTEFAAKHIWGTLLSEVMANHDDFYFFHIPDDEFCRKTLDNGPIIVSRVSLILQPWQSLLELKRDQHDSQPVWIHLRNIPYPLWSAPRISAVARAVSKPLYVDCQMENMKMISYTRVCVEINAK